MAIETDKAQGQEQGPWNPPGPQPIVFEDFSGGLNNDGNRAGIKDNEEWWCDGFFPIAPNYLRTIPDVGPPLYDPSLGPSPPNPPPATSAVIWVPLSSCGIVAFNLADNGNIFPKYSIQGNNTTLTGPAGNAGSFTYAVALDSVGNIYALAFLATVAHTPNGTTQIAKFAPGSNGNVAPLTTMVVTTDPSLNGDNYNGLCIDGTGQIYVGIAGVIYKFAAGSSTPATWQSYPGRTQVSCVFYDYYRQLIWVSFEIIDFSTPNNTLNAYRISDGSLVYEIDGGGILNEITGVCAGKDGRVYCSDNVANTVYVFPNGTNGATAPTQTISGASTLLSNPSGVSVDNIDQTIYVSQGLGNGSADSILVFSEDSTGNVAPIRQITGGNTGLFDFETGDPNAITVA